MHIEYQISEADYVRASWIALRKRSIAGAIRFYYVLVFVILFAFMGTLPLFAVKSVHDFVSWIFPDLFGIALLAYLIFIQWFKFHREYRKSTQLHFQTSLDVEETGVHFTTAISDSRSNWQLYAKFIECKSAFLLIPRGNQGFVPIPKRELTSPQIDELRRLFSTHLYFK